MSTPDSVQLVDFPSTATVTANDLVYSTNVTTGKEQATTIQQLQTFIQAPFANSTLPTASTLSGAETVPLGITGLFQTTLTKIANFVLGQREVVDYTALRIYSGVLKTVIITKPSLSGTFYVDSTDTTTIDNNATVIVDILGRRWKRFITGAVRVDWFGAAGDGVTDDTAAVQAAANAVSTGELAFTDGKTYKFTLMTIQNKVNFVLNCIGATINLAGVSPDGNPTGVRGAGTLTNVKVYGLTVVGDATTTSMHAGWWTPSGTVMQNIEIAYFNIQNCMMGISSNTNLSGDQTDVHIHHGYVANIVGVNSGQGYGVHHANGSGNASKLHIHDVYITGCQRHSIYQAMGSGVNIHDIYISNHRTTVAAGLVRPAVNIVRSSQVQVRNVYGYNIYDGFININKAAVACDDIVVENARVYGIGNAVNPFTIGAQDPTAADPNTNTPTLSPDRVRVRRCHAEYTGVSIDPYRLYNCADLEFDDNTATVTGVTTVTEGVDVQGTGEGTLTTTYSNTWKFRRNRFVITGTAGVSTRLFRLQSAFTNSGISALFEENEGTYSDVTFYPVTAIANPNLTVFNMLKTGLAWSAGIYLAARTLGGPLVSDILTIGSGTPVKKIFQVSQTYDPPAIAAGAHLSVNFSVAGVNTGDAVIISFTSITSSDIQITGQVNNTNNIRVIFSNISTGSLDMASGTISFTIIQF